MADAFMGEIRILPGTYVPAGWLSCNGATLQIAQNRDLFTVISNIYGGDGLTTFMLPNLIGKAPMHRGQGTGLTNRVQGVPGGYATVVINTAEMPNHGHAAMALNAAGNSTVPTDAVWSQNVVSGRTTSISAQFSPLEAESVLNAGALGNTGNNQPHNNMQPYLPVQFIINASGPIAGGGPLAMAAPAAASGS